MVDRNEILELIRKLARERAGIPPGKRVFGRLTGIPEYSWYGRYWSCWSDAVAEAGLEPLRPTPRFEDKELLERLCKLATALGKFPSVAQLRMAKRRDPSFPTYDVFRERFGTVERLAQRVAAFAKEHPEHSSVIPLCKSNVDDPGDTASSANGYVYLVKDGRRYKIGRTQLVEDRIPELTYQSSHRIDLVHKIATDDPPGIERYWHERFKDKRKYGEWFELDVRDIEAFRRRKKFM